MKRTGPKPLSYHISMAAQQSVSGAENAQKNSAAEQVEKMLRGIQLYQNSPLSEYKSAREIVWSKGSVSLQHICCGDVKLPGQKILLVPSLVNSAAILDLVEERSFALWLAQQGMDVFILDWGALCSDFEQSDLNVLIQQRLIPAAEFLKAENNDKEITALGYCMGGTLLVGASALCPELFEKAVFLATPWDFHNGDQKLTQHVQGYAAKVLGRLEAKETFPADWLQILFSTLDPKQVQQKFMRFADVDPFSFEGKLFVAVEDWINSGQDLPCGIVREAIEGWFVENNPAKDEWILGERKVDLGAVNFPTLIVASSQDKLVDASATFCLRERIAHSDFIDPACGHIGMIAGRKSIENVWRPILNWLQKEHV